MFRSRNEELSHLINLQRSLGSLSHEQIIIDNPDLLEPNIQDVAKFLQDEIESFSTKVIESMILSKLVDFQFVDHLYQHDKILFEKIFQNAIAKGFKGNNFQTSLMIVLRVTFFQQAIIGFDSIYQEMITNKSIYKKELHELFKKLIELESMEGFQNIPVNEKTRTMELHKNLKPFSKFVPEKPKPKEPVSTPQEEANLDTKGLDAVLNLIETDSTKKKDFADLTKELQDMSAVDFSKLTDDQKTRFRNLVDFIKPQISKLDIKPATKEDITDTNK